MAKRQPRPEPFSVDELDEIAKSPALQGFDTFLRYRPTLVPPASALPDKEKTADPAPTPVGNLPTATTRQHRLFRALTAQDGHTVFEQAVYDHLWRSGKASGAESCREAPGGYRQVAAATHLDPKTIKRHLHALEQKLAIEQVSEFTSSTNEPRRYRVYSYRQILDRRRQAGLEWIIRKPGGGIVLAGNEPPPVGNLPPPRVGNLPPGPGENLPPGPVGNLPPPPVGNLPPHLLETTAGNCIDTSASSVVCVLSEILGASGIDADDAGLAALVSACQARAPDATAAEIAHFTRLKLDQAIRGRRVRNLVGFLQTAVPPCFDGELLRRLRANEAAAIRAQSRGREVDEEYWRRCAEKTLEDPEASEAERAAARAVLGEEGDS